MGKICRKCGRQMEEDDFLCPSCGAIWGDRIYRAPKETQPTQTDYEEPDFLVRDAPSAPSEEAEKSEQRRHPHWLWFGAALCVILALVLFLLGTDQGLWAGESSNTTGTIVPTTQPPATLPSTPESMLVRYTVYFQDPFGEPISNVGIFNPWNLPSFGSLVITDQLHSDKNGKITFVQYKQSNTETQIHILSVPEGYDQTAVGYKRSFAEGQTEMVIILGPDRNPVVAKPISYTVTLIVTDEDGNPVPKVTIRNLENSMLYKTNEQGTFAFQYSGNSSKQGVFTYEFVAIPDGYDKEFLGQTYILTFSEEKNVREIILPFEAPVPPEPNTFAVTMSDTICLYEPLQDAYAAGDTVIVKLVYDKSADWMLFANGREVEMYGTDGKSYCEFRFIMPAEPVKLTWRRIGITAYDDGAQAMLRTYYRLYPDADETYLMQYYGQYGQASVGMLKLYSTGIEPIPEIVAGYVFDYPTRNSILVLVDGAFISLEKAYANGYLTDADIERIYILFCIYTATDEPTIE